VEFIVFDVETTGLDRETEICQLSFVRFVDGVQADDLTTLVKPSYAAKWRSQAVEIHGITKAKVKDAPKLSQLKDSIHEYVAGKVLFAHNASFDVNRLMAEAGINLEAYCTLKMCSVLHLSTTSKKLDDICGELGIYKNEIHDALGDSIACAQLVVHILESQKVQSAKQLSKQFAYAICNPTISSFELAEQGPKNNQALRRAEFAEAASNPKFGSIHNAYFKGKTVVFSDTKISKPDAQKLVMLFGGESFDHINKSLDFLVVHDLSSETSKAKRAREFIAKGAKIQIIDEANFISLAEESGDLQSLLML